MNVGYYAAETDSIAARHGPLLDTILAARRPDGDLNTYYENPLLRQQGRRRFHALNRFEFYNFGHFTQAVIACVRATGDRQRLDTAVRFADLLVRSRSWGASRTCSPGENISQFSVADSS